MYLCMLAIPIATYLPTLCISVNLCCCVYVVKSEVSSNPTLLETTVTTQLIAEGTYNTYFAHVYSVALSVSYSYVRMYVVT